jgi:hypothetical protein
MLPLAQKSMATNNNHGRPQEIILLTFIARLSGLADNASRYRETIHGKNDWMNWRFSLYLIKTFYITAGSHL